MDTSKLLEMRGQWANRATNLYLVTLDMSRPVDRRARAFRLWYEMEARLHLLHSGIFGRIESLINDSDVKPEGRFPPGGVFAEGNDEFVIPK